MTTPATKKDPIEVRTQAVLAREDGDRAEQARETARRELEDEQRAQEEQAVISGARERLQTMDPKPLEEARAAAAKALAGYGEAIDNWNAELAQVGTDLAGLSSSPAHISMGGAITLDGIEVYRVGLQRQVAELATEAVRARRPREPISLDTPFRD